MKKMLLAVLIIIIASNVQAQAPQGIAFQAIARNLNGSPIANHSLQVRFSVLDSAANGTAVYVETHNTTTNTLGLFSLSVGLGTAVTNTFATINWGKNDKFLKTEIDADGTGNWLNLGIQQMMSVPYALYAGTSTNTSSGFKHYIGEWYGGGVVFNVYKDSAGNEHGLIVAPKLVDTGSYRWCDSLLKDTSCNATSPIDGKANTQKIINKLGTNGIAAYMCDTATINGYTDWYLPSLNEIMAIQSNSPIINITLNQQKMSLVLFLNTILTGDNLISDAYWSSTESRPYGTPTKNIYVFNARFRVTPFVPGPLEIDAYYKYAKRHILAIRSF